MTPRHWLIFAFIAVLFVVGALLIVANGNRPDDNADATIDAGEIETPAAIE